MVISPTPSATSAPSSHDTLTLSILLILYRQILTSSSLPYMSTCFGKIFSQ